MVASERQQQPAAAVDGNVDFVARILELLREVGAHGGAVFDEEDPHGLKLLRCTAT